jgi:hypothetical protein
MNIKTRDLMIGDKLIYKLTGEYCIVDSIFTTTPTSPPVGTPLAPAENTAYAGSSDSASKNTPGSDHSRQRTANASITSGHKKDPILSNLEKNWKEL